MELHQSAKGGSTPPIGYVPVPLVPPMTPPPDKGRTSGCNDGSRQRPILTCHVEWDGVAAIFVRPASVDGARFGGSGL